MGEEEVRPSQRVVGRYALYGALAAGGMATVHLGRLLGPAGFSRTVAVKRLHAHFARDRDFVSMLLDEARLCGRIRHPNVVPTLDVVAGKGQLLLVMEYVAGDSLARLFRAVRVRGDKIPLPILGSIMSGVLRGLHAAHEAKDEAGEPLGIVHRDVSPHNVMVGVDGIARVLDFGIAKARGRLFTTQDGKVKGKFAYMSPEQVRATPLDRRSDVFSASVMLWELLAGRRLFDAENEAAMVAKVLLDRIEPPSRHRSDITPELDAVVLAGLAREREDRIQTAREMAVRLERAIPPAPIADVGEWVEANAREVLAMRAARVAEIESGVAPPAASSMEEVVTELISDSDVGDSLSSSSLLLAREPASSVTTTAATITSPTQRGTARSPSAAPGPGSLPAPMSRASTLGVAAVAVVMGLAAVVWLRTPSPAPSSSPSPSPSTAAAPSSSSAPAPVPTVSVNLSATPASARIYLDDALVEGNPYVTTAPKGVTAHRVRAELPGYVARETTVTFDGEVNVRLELAKQPRSTGGHAAGPDSTVKRSIDINDPYAR